MFTKKSELTRVESLALSIVQWCLLNPLEGKDARHIFFTQITVSTVKVSELKRIPMALHNRGEAGCDGTDIKLPKNGNYKAIKILAYFTSLEEPVEYGREGMPPARPCIEAEMVFENTSSGFYLWFLQACHVVVKNYDRDCNFFYHKYFPVDEKQFGDKGPHIKQMELVFPEFFSTLSNHAPWGGAVIGDK